MPSPQAEEFTVLVVDDDPGARVTLGGILQLHGFQVLSAETGEAAIEAVKTSPRVPGLALLDLQLPDIDGLVLGRALREHVPQLQIVILTGHASLDSAVTAIRNDTADYLIKPVAPDHLIKSVQQARDRWRSAHVETAILGSLERFRAVIENLSELVTVVEPGGRIIYESPAINRILGYEVNERLGQWFDDFVHPDDRKQVEQGMADARAGADVSRCLVRAISADGSYKSIEICARCIVKDAPIEGLILTSRDVTEKMKLEAQLRQAQKMEAIGQLSGGIAHELNNLLAVVTANAEAALQDIPRNSHLYRDIADAHDAARHGARLIQKLLGFSRRERLCTQPTDVVRLMDRIVPRIRRTLPKKITLELNQEGDGACVALVDRDAFEQIVINLVNNARDAMPKGGVISISAQPEEVDAEFVATHLGATLGQYICLTVGDRGLGMDATTVDRIFEPFFSTKSVANGTGLGMAMVYGLTKQQGGYIAVASAPGEGTTVKVYLPATDEAPVPLGEHTSMTQRDPSRAGSTILVVEDQEKLRKASRRVLERLGYNAITARDGAEALACLDRVGNRIDLIVADVVMPNMGGLELHETITKKGLRVPTLFMSGFSAQDIRGGELLGSQFPLLQKPWTVDELARAVESALRSRHRKSA